MNILYLECKMGAAGDMLTAALSELHPDPDGFIKRLNGCGFHGVSVNCERSMKCGVAGTHISVLIDGEEELEHFHHSHGGEHHHHHMCVSDIAHIIEHLDLSEKVKKDAVNVFMLLADAESKAHGTTIEQVHFHEVGTIDAVCDIVAVCMLIDELKPEKIFASPVNVGGGFVKCAHGVLPVPAPATAELLKGIPVYSGEIKSELCTPTGAALLKYFVDEFTEMPKMIIRKTGYGMGKKDFHIPNCVRAFYGELLDDAKESVTEICCNIDDMTGEELGYAVSVLLEKGALDVWTTPIYMKKGRPAVMLSCLCKTETRDKFARLIFKYTTTIGVRIKEYSRVCLDREITVKDTPFGKIRVKKVSGNGVTREKAEFDDIIKIAEDNGISPYEVKKLI